MAQDIRRLLTRPRFASYFRGSASKKNCIAEVGLHRHKEGAPDKRYMIGTKDPSSLGAPALRSFFFGLCAFIDSRQDEVSQMVFLRSRVEPIRIFYCSMW